jgi:O-antigen/teichoic acid export membrane protein
MSRTLKSILWSTAGSWGQQFVAFATTLVLARLLDPSDFGVITTAMLAILVIQRLLIETIGHAVVRWPEFTPQVANTAFWTAVIIASVLAACLFFLAPLLAGLLREPALTGVLKQLSILPVLDGLSTVQTAKLKREMRHKILAMRTFVGSIAGMIVGTTMAFLDFGVTSLVMQQLTMSFVSVITLWSASGWRPALSADRGVAVRMFQFSYPLIGSSLLYVVANRLDVVALTTTMGSAPTGLYALAKRISRLLTDLIVTGTNTVSLSTFASSQHSPSLMQENLTKYLLFSSFLFMPAFCGLSIVSDDLIVSLLGEKWRGAAPALAILAVAGLFQSITLIVTNALLAAGATGSILSNNAATAALLAISLLFGCHYGVAGVAAAFAAPTVMATALAFYQLKRRLDVQISALLRALAPSAAGTTSMLVCVFAVQFFSGLPASPQRLALCVTVGLLTYVLHNMFLNRGDFKIVTDATLTALKGVRKRAK